MNAEQADLSGVIEVPLSEARSRLASLVSSVIDDDTFVYLTRHGKRVAVLMPADAGENYERLEDEYWTRRAQEAVARLASGEEELIPFAQLVAEAESREESPCR